MFFSFRKHSQTPAPDGQQAAAQPDQHTFPGTPQAGLSADDRARVQDVVATLAPVTTVQEMRQWDALAVELGLSGFALMENAAQGARRVLLAHVPKVRGLCVHLLMGAGNNGGDAACLARQLLDLGANPVVFHTKDLAACQGETAQHVQLAQACGVPFRPAREFSADCDIVVDGLLGTGFTGSLREDALQLVRCINDGRQSFTLALDIPSGLDAATGRPCPEAVRADATATFAAAKPGLVLPWAKPWTGSLHVVYIGTPRRAADQAGASYRLLEDSILAHLPAPVPCGHKNSYGHVLVAGGAHGMCGAAHIAARAALRAGAGLVTCAAPGRDADHIRLGMPEIMIQALGGASETSWSKSQAAELAARLERAACLVAGPGMGRDKDSADFLQALLALPRSCPMVLDADGLMLLAAQPKLTSLLHPGDVITPHPGEAAALLGTHPAEVTADPFAAARNLAENFGCTVVLKGAASLVAARDMPVLILAEDICQLSVGGSGDCLAGVIAALLARRLPAPLAAALGTVWHGAAGILLGRTYPGRGNLATDIADALPAAGQIAHSAAAPECDE